MKKKILASLLAFFANLSFISQPFAYDLHLSSIPGKSSDIMIVAHGMSGNYKIAESIKIDKTLISFNFPDHDYGQRLIEADKTTFGTIDELLPLLYVIKKSVIDDNHQEIDLYGYSAGGGAIVNAIGILNITRYDDRLEKIGILRKDKEKMLQAIQKGLIILDSPLKSISEIIDFRGSSPELEIFAKRYQENDMEPINALKNLKGLSLNIIVHFQIPDAILSNRDDDLFFTLLKKYNINGTTKLIIGKDGGHNVPHPSLWNFYFKETHGKNQEGHHGKNGANHSYKGGNGENGENVN